MPSLSARSGRSVVIAGAGKGLAREIALGLATRGYIVFGTATSAEEAEELWHTSRGRVSLIVCDIKKVEAVTAWADGISDAVGNAGVDILIINTRGLASGPLELLPIDAIRHEFDVNVFACLAIINAFLPALRTAHGRIVQISSWMSSLQLPFSGPSEASHAAMEVFAAVYRAELRPFGIDVLVVSHDPMPTESSTATAALARIGRAMTAGQRKLYGRSLSAFLGNFGSAPSDELDLAADAARVVELAEQHPAPARAAIGRYTEQQISAFREAPDAALSALRQRSIDLS
ncbi:MULTISPECIES: SDR family NAD(P)-dependent oxidoreductase [Bradyrhizobium]|uniref:SDR family NAD(P)-dependent oxidoreductase n=1 Tax=Bradyrhizobium elkanii TaxID=29448 RepID=UPI00041B2367|nr:SDR family NAD(P)-dependent oxidoreductase [Bradyrhizobium elkanii]